MATSECANPLFLSWVKEWWDQAKERNTKGVLAYRTAHESLRVCPIRFDHPDQLLALRGFGPKLCSRLLERLVAYCSENSLPVPSKKRLPRASLDLLAGSIAAPSTAESSVANTLAAAAAGGVSGSSRSSGPRKRKAYVPVPRQGGYAILMALSSPEAQGREWLGKAELIGLAQPHCDSSFTVRPPGKFYTAWESIKTLQNHGLVSERQRPAKRFSLTDEGWDMAQRLRHVAGETVAAPRRADGSGSGSGSEQAGDGRAPAATAIESLIPDGQAVDSVDALPRVQPTVWPAGSYAVQLVLDNRERVTGQRTYIEDELAKRGVKPAVRALSLGDALWVAKRKPQTDGGRVGGRDDDNGDDGDDGINEVVLDWIVERKRQDDLVGSIKDGRFREQKFRLRRSGVRHVVYVVEEGGLDADVQHRYEDAMQSAVAATQVVDGFFVKKTRSVDDTIAYLARLTGLLEKRYAGRALHILPTAALTAQNHLPLLSHLREGGGGGGGGNTSSSDTSRIEYCIAYEAFASLSSKSELLTLRDVFLKMLMCTRGVTGERALEIQKRWKTPYAFAQAFQTYGLLQDGVASDDAHRRKRQREMVSDALGGLPGSKRRVSKIISDKIAETWADARVPEE